MSGLRIGARTVLAVTCLGCGHLIQGVHVERCRRTPQDRVPYVDRRCKRCRVGHLEERRRGVHR